MFTNTLLRMRIGVECLRFFVIWLYLQIHSLSFKFQSVISFISWHILVRKSCIKLCKLFVLEYINVGRKSRPGSAEQPGCLRVTY